MEMCDSLWISMDCPIYMIAATSECFWIMIFGDSSIIFCRFSCDFSMIMAKCGTWLVKEAQTTGDSQLTSSQSWINQWDEPVVYIYIIIYIIIIIIVIIIVLLLIIIIIVIIIIVIIIIIIIIIYIYITLIHIYIYITIYIYIIMISGDIISYCGSGYNRCWLWWGLCGIPSWWHRQPGWIPYGTQSLLDSPQCHIWIAMKYPIYSPFWPVKNKSHDISPVVVDNKPHLPGKSSRNDYDHHLNHSS